MPEPVTRPPISPDRLRVNPDRVAAREEREELRRAEAEEGHQRRAEEAADFSFDATPARNAAPNTQPGPNFSRESSKTTGSPSEFSTTQDEFSGPKSSQENTAPDSQPTEAQKPRQPLPDLRQGIPSTFAEEYLKEQAKADAQDAKAHHDINITEDPAHASSEGGAAGRGGGGEGELPRSAYETSIDKRRNRVANWSYLIMVLSAAGASFYFGRNWESEEEEKAHPDAPSGWGFQLFWNRIKARWNGQMGYYTEPTFPKLLPSMDPAPPYTLVLSLEDLMIHSDWTREHGWRTAKRPGLDFFLRYLAQYYEIVLFTSMPFTYADPIMRKLDPFHIIQWPLFREATRYEKGQYIKVGRRKN
jgi:mitochondrial import inner membrane translocase subunit TIM50